MSMQNLAIVFGPTLFGQPLTPDGASGPAMPETFHENLVCRPQIKFSFDKRSDRNSAGD
jgi:hypothetical protein